MKKIGYFSLQMLFVLIMMSASVSKGADQPEFRAAWKSSFTGAKGHNSWTSEKAAFVTSSIENPQMPGINNYIEKKRKFLFFALPPKRIALGGVATNAFKAGDLIRYKLPDEHEVSGHIDQIYGKHIIIVDGQAVTSPWIISKIE